MMVPVSRRWRSVAEISEIFSLHPVSVRKMIARGEIGVVRLGRAIRIDIEALEIDLKRRAQGQPAGARRKTGR